VRIDLSRYVKNIHNFQDKDQFLDTPIFFPIAIAQGDVRGQEVRIDLAPVHGFSAYVSYANSKAVGTTPLVGGIFLGEEDPTFLTPGVQFDADHDQRNTATFGVTYNVRKNLWTSFNGRYESGTPSEIDPAEFAALPPGAQESLDPARGRVKPRTIMDISAGWDAMQDRAVPVTFLFTVSNLTDKFYYFDFGSVFSGTHVGRPREFAGRLVFHLKGKSKPSTASGD
jgi:outer membrane receptor protein involved in Fe transport